MKKFLICLTLFLSFNSAYANGNPHSAVYNGDQIFHSNYESKWSLIDINTNDKLVLTRNYQKEQVVVLSTKTKITH